MKRRDFITFLGGATAWPLAARAQPDGRVPLLGWLDAYDNSDTGFQSIRTALREALAKLGWIEGRNLKVEGRFGVTDANRLRAAAVESRLSRARRDRRPSAWSCAWSIRAMPARSSARLRPSRTARTAA